jgi:hypothetical protein
MILGSESYSVTLWAATMYLEHDSEPETGTVLTLKGNTFYFGVANSGLGDQLHCYC